LLSRSEPIVAVNLGQASDKEKTVTTSTTSTTSATSTQTPDYAAIKNRQRLVWGSGDFHVIASLIVPISERLCDSVELRPGERVLDLATGSGNTAIAAARRLCSVDGVDYAPSLLERARVRSEAEGFEITFEEGDIEELPTSDGAYDVVLSTLGVMFSPNHEKAAHELLRVCRPGGRIGLANWTPEGFVGEMLRAVGRHVPAPAGVRPATRWGSEEGIGELIGHGVESLQARREAFVYRFASAEQYLHLFRSYYGPVHKAFLALDDVGQQALANDLRTAVERYAQPLDDTIVVPAEYLEVVAVRTA
jgi:ubiquinone/menaquinone biosynthesis C-methylase UbiE